MGFISWIIVGLVCGLIAKLIYPGKQGIGWILTLLIGIVGAIVGGLIGSLFGSGLGGLGDFRTWLWGIIGSLVVLAIYLAIQRRTVD